MPTTFRTTLSTKVNVIKEAIWILLWAHNKTVLKAVFCLQAQFPDDVVVTTERSRNVDRLCENCRIIKGMLCILLEDFRQII